LILGNINAAENLNSNSFDEMVEKFSTLKNQCVGLENNKDIIDFNKEIQKSSIKLNPKIREAMISFTTEHYCRLIKLSLLFKGDKPAFCDKEKDILTCYFKFTEKIFSKTPMDTTSILLYLAIGTAINLKTEKRYNNSLPENKSKKVLKELQSLETGLDTIMLTVQACKKLSFAMNFSNYYLDSKPYPIYLMNPSILNKRAAIDTYSLEEQITFMDYDYAKIGADTRQKMLPKIISMLSKIKDNIYKLKLESATMDEEIKKKFEIVTLKYNSLSDKFYYFILEYPEFLKESKNKTVPESHP
jgi:hypothetical protein